MRTVPAITLSSVLLTTSAALVTGAQEPGTDVEFLGDIDDEIIVTAEKPERGEMPSPTYIVQTYSVVNRGSRLYREGRYSEALPYLVTAAKRGFKWAQARAGDIYLHGRGGVARDIEAGIGWLGVAAMPETDPAIRNYFRDAMAEVRPEHLLHFATIVADYRRQWGSDGYRVTCERAPKIDGIHGSQSLRMKRLRCTFMDEIPLCRTPYGDPSGAWSGSVTSRGNSRWGAGADCCLATAPRLGSVSDSHS